jgi:hypothetical protein
MDKSTVLNYKEKCSELRGRYPRFFYHSHETKLTSKSKDQSYLIITFSYEIEGLTDFESTFNFPFLAKYPPDLNSLEPLIFNLGLIELLSYWKATCSPEVIIKSGGLEDSALGFWKKIFFLGLGEFRYINGLEHQYQDFVNFTSSGATNIYPESNTTPNGILIPVGGGKDSIVTIELLRRQYDETHLFLLNPRLSSLKTAETAGYKEQQVINVNRQLDPRLLQLNNEGFLNGHTPFSALLAFSSLLSAKIYNKEHVILSNESSASESNLLGTEINHQYSKSLEFESDFRNYASSYLLTKPSYFSILRPLNELQISKIFSGLTKYHHVFKSCNVGHYTDIWCGKCSKCIFTAIMLAPFISRRRLIDIFSKDLFLDLDLMQTTRELFLKNLIKPFECVGTRAEVAGALAHLTTNTDYKDTPLIKAIAEELPENTTDILNLLSEFNENHFVPEKYLDIISFVQNKLKYE